MVRVLNEVPLALVVALLTLAEESFWLLPLFAPLLPSADSVA